jgi:hypothetical protein
MHRLHRFLALAALVSLLGSFGAAWEADAQQRPQAQPAPQPRIIDRDRWLQGPPPPPSSNRNYYGPAPGIQQPMERVPLPAPLAEPPTNR